MRPLLFCSSGWLVDNTPRNQRAADDRNTREIPPFIPISCVKRALDSCYAVLSSVPDTSFSSSSSSLIHSLFLDRRAPREQLRLRRTTHPRHNLARARGWKLIKRVTAQMSCIQETDLYDRPYAGWGGSGVLSTFLYRCRA